MVGPWAASPGVVQCAAPSDCCGNVAPPRQVQRLWMLPDLWTAVSVFFSASWPSTLFFRFEIPIQLKLPVQDNKAFEITADFPILLWKGHYVYAKIMNVESQISTRRGGGKIILRSTVAAVVLTFVCKNLSWRPTRWNYFQDVSGFNLKPRPFEKWSCIM